VVVDGHPCQQLPLPGLFEVQQGLQQISEGTGGCCVVLYSCSDMSVDALKMTLL
jgi:hypothetical protein